MATNWLDKAIGYIDPVAGARRAQARALTARINRTTAKYDGAGHGRRNEGWIAHGTSANAETRAALAIMRARHRDLVRNNPYAANAMAVLQNNIVGTGIKPRAIASSDRVQKQAEQTIRAWASSIAVDIDEQHNLYGLQSLAVRAAMESGDCLIVRHYERDSRLPVPLKLRLLEGDYLDHSKNGPMENGYAVMGVQFNAQHRRVGYWLHKDHPGNSFGLGTTFTGSVLTPAADVIHLFEALRPGMVRGVPRGTAALERMRLLDDYQDARVEAQKSAACLVGIVIEPDAQPGESKGDVLPEKLEPGMFPRLAPGQDVRFNNPPQVPQSGTFVAEEQHSIAIAYGVPYSALTGNLSSVNFSSGRMGSLEFKRTIEHYRAQVLMPLVCNRLADWFSEAADLAGLRFANVRWDWSAPRYQMQDPSREVPPMVALARAGFAPVTTQLRELGYDPEDIIADYIRERRQFADNGLIFTTDAGQVSDQGQQQPVPTDPDNPRPQPSE